MSPRLESGGTDTERDLSFGGAGRSRTGDPLLAKQVLYQLSYDPIGRDFEKNITLRNLLCAIN